jgi:hypothetical protein
MHEELQEENIDLMDDVLDDVPADSPYKVLAITFASMKEFSEWKIQHNFNWFTIHRSKKKGIFEENEPSFIHYKCNSSESCTVEMRMEYERTTGGKKNDEGCASRHAQCCQWLVTAGTEAK